MTARILALHAAPAHTFSKRPALFLDCLEGQGIAGDAHCGATVKHRSRVARDPTQPNLRQVHLLEAERLAELRAQGFPTHPGDLGENLTTEGLDLLALPRAALLRIGAVTLEVTGLRNPCVQLDRFAPGLMAACLARGADGRLLLRAGIMAIVRTGGRIQPGEEVHATLPPPPHQLLERV